MDRTQAEDIAQRMADDAAKQASTVGAFRSNFERSSEHIVGGDGAQALPPMLVETIEQRRRLIERATMGLHDRTLEEKPDGVLGTNTIGGGENGIAHSKQALSDVKDDDDADALAVTDEHEKGHGDAVQLRGELSIPELRGTTVAQMHLLLHEGYAEVRGNEGTNQSIDTHRSGQPREVYREGQDLVCALIRRTSRARVEELMTGDGDLGRFQTDLASSSSH